MPVLPLLDKNVNNSPHVVILGAGASNAAFPNGDIKGKQLYLMNNLVEITELSKILNKEGIRYKNRNFEDIYSRISSNKKYKLLAQDIETKIYEYFSDMVIPDEPTIYDYLLLSLREKDLIASFNWDPLLLQACKRNAHIKNLPRPVFLHGNVGMGVCNDHKNIGYIESFCNSCGKKLEPVKLLYPVKKKDYSSNPAIKSEWTLLRSKLKEAYFLTIFGYSAPVSDVEAKKLLLEAWSNNRSLSLAEIEIIDKKNEKEVKTTWKEFIPREQHCSIWDNFYCSYLWHHPRRTCESFAGATLMGKPWRENKFPKVKTLIELHDWIAPLLEDEIRYGKSTIPFQYMAEPFLSK